MANPTRVSGLKLGPTRVARDKIATTLQGSALSVVKKGTITATAFTDFSLGVGYQIKTFTIPGLAVGDSVFLSPRSALAFGTGPYSFLVWQARCSAANTLTVIFADTATGSQNGLLGLTPTFDYLVVR